MTGCIIKFGDGDVFVFTIVFFINYVKIMRILFVEFSCQQFTDTRCKSSPSGMAGRVF